MDKKDNSTTSQPDGEKKLFENLDYVEFVENAMRWPPKFKAQLVCWYWIEADLTGSERMSREQFLAIDNSFNAKDRPVYERYIHTFNLYMQMACLAHLYYWEISAAGFALLRCADIIKEYQRKEKAMNAAWKDAKGTPLAAITRKRLRSTRLQYGRVIFSSEGLVIDRTAARAETKKRAEIFISALLHGRAFVSAVEKYAKRHGGIDMLTMALDKARKLFRSDWAHFVLRCPEYSREFLCKKSEKGKLVTPDQWEVAVFPDGRNIMPEQEDIDIFTEYIKAEERILNLREKYEEE